MLLLSIDPGIVNIGVCVYDNLKKKIIFADKLQIYKNLKEHKKLGECNLTNQVYETFFSKDSPIFKYLKKIKICLIEIQMKSLFKIISHVIHAFCFEKNIKVYHISPRSIKKYFHTSAYNKKTRKSSHLKNKKLAIKKMEILFPSLMENKKKENKKVDDICDAILQVLYFCEKLKK